MLLIDDNFSLEDDTTPIQNSREDWTTQITPLSVEQNVEEKKNIDIMHGQKLVIKGPMQFNR